MFNHFQQHWTTIGQIVCTLFYVLCWQFFWWTLRQELEDKLEQGFRNIFSYHVTWKKDSPLVAVATLRKAALKLELLHTHYTVPTSIAQRYRFLYTVFGECTLWVYILRTRSFSAHFPQLSVLSEQSLSFLKPWTQKSWIYHPQYNTTVLSVQGT